MTLKPCPHCSKATKSNLDLLCTNCRRLLLFSAKFGHGTLPILLWTILGVSVVLASSVFATTLLAFAVGGYVAAILRYDVGLRDALLALLMAFACVLSLSATSTAGAPLLQLLSIPPDLDRSTAAASVVAGVLLISLLGSWRDACARSRIGLLAGLPALSATLTVVMLCLKWGFSAWSEDAWPAVVTYLSQALSMRLVLLAIVMVPIVIWAMVTVSQTGITPTEPYFEAVDHRDDPGPAPTQGVWFTLVEWARTMVTDWSVWAFNLVWIGAVSGLKFLGAWGSEVLEVMKKELIIAGQTLTTFIRWHLLLVAVAFGIAIAVRVLEQHLGNYLLGVGSSWSSLGWLLGSAAILAALLVLLVMLSSDGPANEIVESVGRSHVWLSFVVVVSVFGSWLVLWSAAQAAASFSSTIESRLAARVANALMPFQTWGPASKALLFGGSAIFVWALVAAGRRPPKAAR